MRTDQEILADYWAAHAQFGPFDVKPQDFVAAVRAGCDWCCICLGEHNGGRRVPATRRCNELKRPVCDHHARFCVEESHGTSELKP